MGTGGASGGIKEDDAYTVMVSDGNGGYEKRRYGVDEVKVIFDSTEEDARVEEVDVVRDYDVTRTPFFAFDMKGECREVEHQTRIHCGAEMTDEFVPELIQRWNARAVATASIDKEVMAGTVHEVMERIPNALRILEDSQMATAKERRELATNLKSLSEVVPRGDNDTTGFIEALDDVLFDFGPNEMSDIAKRLADLIEPEPERTCVRTLVKSGPVYDVWHFDCCDREYAENKTDAVATELPLNVCPFCGTGVMREGRDAVHG